jgi:hypothetical protein
MAWSSDAADGGSPGESALVPSVRLWNWAARLMAAKRSPIQTMGMAAGFCQKRSYCRLHVSISPSSSGRELDRDNHLVQELDLVQNGCEVVCEQSVGHFAAI